MSRAFTLIEAIIAVTMIALVAGACLQLRAESLARVRSLSGTGAADLAADQVLRLAVADRLGPGQPLEPDDPQSPRVWTGEHAGRPYELQREAVAVPNPLREATDEDSVYPVSVIVWRYTLTMGDTVRTMEWTR